MYSLFCIYNDTKLRNIRAWLIYIGCADIGRILDFLCNVVFALSFQIFYFFFVPEHNHNITTFTIMESVSAAYLLKVVFESQGMSLFVIYVPAYIVSNMKS